MTKERGVLLSALLTIARAWFASGKPKPEGLATIGSFEEWSETIGGMLAHAGVEGFLGNLDELHDRADESEIQWRGFLLAIMTAVQTDNKQNFNGKTFTVNQLFTELKWNETLRNTFPDELTWEEKALGSFPKRLGKALAKRDGRRYGPELIHIERPGSEHSAVVWAVRCS